MPAWSGTFCRMLLAAAALIWTSAAQAEERIALLIANSDYPSAVGRLGAQPAADAERIAAALRAAGFKRSNIVIQRDLDGPAMRRAIRAFSQRLRGGGKDVVGFFYYSGHGASAKIGEEGGDYLLPAKTEITKPYHLIDDNRGLPVRSVINQLRRSLAGAPKGVLFVVLDSCRNTLAPSFNRSGSRGFGAAPNTSGVLISYAAPAGAQTPNDGYFASVLAAEIQRPGQSALEAFSAAGRKVSRRTGALPVLAPALNRKFCFRGCAGGGNPAADLLRRAKEANSAKLLEAVMAAYPNTPEARAAERLLAALKPAQPAAASDGFGAKLRAAGARGLAEFSGGPVMVAIPAGSFTMGSPSSETLRESDEGPQRQVSVPAFAIGKYEITFAQWDACAADGYCRPVPRKASGKAGHDAGWGRGARPVIAVSWNDITGADGKTKGFVAWLNSKVTGSPYRLPSEAEWEYAARAGSEARFSFGDDDAQLVEYAWYGRNSGRKTHPVGGKRPNRWGLHDMHGNVYERVQDCWNKTYEGAPNDGSAWMSGDCSRAVLRSGSWAVASFSARSANRHKYQRASRYDDVGFRIARTLGD